MWSRNSCRNSVRRAALNTLHPSHPPPPRFTPALTFIIPNPIPILNLDSRAHLIELLLGAKAIPGFTLVDDVYHAVESCGSKILDGAFTHMAPPLASNTGERTSL